MHTKLLQACLCDSLWPFVTLWTVARQAPLSMGILQTRILERVGLPCPPPGDPLHPGIESTSHSVSCIVRWALYYYCHLGAPKILEWLAIPFSRQSSWLRDHTRISWIASRFLMFWATRKELEPDMGLNVSEPETPHGFLPNNINSKYIFFSRTLEYFYTSLIFHWKVWKQEQRRTEKDSRSRFRAYSTLWRW